MERCPWCLSDDVYIAYHDDEWGVIVRDDRKLFEFLLLEGAQAGLSWITVLKKRKHYREVFDDFDPYKIAKYDNKKIQALLNDSGIIRNRRKIEAFIKNSKIFVENFSVKGSFDSFLWSFVDNKPIIHYFKTNKEVFTTSDEAILMSKELKKLGFSFVGPTICYAFMQAVGMVNDHLVNCYRHKEICSKNNK